MCHICLTTHLLLLFFPLLNKEKDSEEVDEKENDEANEKRTPEELEEASELSELDRRAIELFTTWLKEQKE